MTGESAAPRVLRSRLRIASTNGSRPWRSKSVRHFVRKIRNRGDFADLAPALSRRSFESRAPPPAVSGQSLHTIQTRTPCPPPRSPPSSPSPRRAPPRAARLGRLPARSAARSAPRRPTPSTRASPCSSTATGSSSRPVRGDRLLTLDLCARRGHARRPPHSVSATTRVPRARSLATPPPSLATRSRLARRGRARLIRRR